MFAFKELELNLLNFCNRNCWFCPQKNKTEFKYIELELIDKITSELSSIKFNGSIYLSGFCEPLLHPNLNEIIIKIKNNIQHVKLAINTNGDFLTELKIRELLAAGIDEIRISLYDGPLQFKYFKEVIEKFKTNNKIFLRKRYEGFNKNNRAGYFVPSENVPIDKVCYYPFNFLYIDYDGEILFCPHNFKRVNSLGNLKDKKLITAWNSDKLEIIRSKLASNTRKIEPCIKCDVNGTLKGSKNYEIWKKSK